MASSKTNVSDYRFSIFINNAQAKQSVMELEKVIQGYEATLKDLEKNGQKGTDQYKSVKDLLDSARKSQVDLKKEAGLTAMSLKDLKGLYSVMLNEWARSIPGSPERAKLAKELTAVSDRINTLKVGGEQVKGVFSHITSYLLELGTAAAAAFSLNAIKNYVKEGMEASIKLKDSEKMLLDVLDGQSDKQKELIQLAKDKALTSKNGRLDIEESEKFLVIQGRTQAQIRTTIQAATDLSVVTGKTLKESVEDLDGTMEGKMSKGLGKLEKDFKTLSKEQMYNGDAIEMVRKKYAGLAEGEMRTQEGMLNLLQKGWNALQRTIGGWAMGSGGAFDSLVKGATQFLGTIQKLFEIPLSEKLADESMKVNMLASNLTDLNITAEERNKLYMELKEIAPSVVAGLDSESISYTKLTSNLAAYNNEMVNKIILQKEDEKIDDKNNDLAKARMKRIEQENYIRQKALENWARMTAEAKNQNAANAGATKKQIEDERAIFNNSNLTFSQKMTQLGKTTGAYFAANNMYQMLAETENKALVAQTIAMNDKKKLITDLGIVQTDTGKKTEETHKKVISGVMAENEMHKKTLAEMNDIIAAGAVMGATETEKKNARLADEEIKRRQKVGEVEKNFEQDYKAFLRDIAVIQGNNFAEKLSQTQADIKAINDRYDLEIRKIEEFQIKKKENLTLAENKELDNKQNELQIQKDQQTKQILEQSEKIFSDNIIQIHEQLRIARMSVTDRQVYEVNQKYDDLQKEILGAIEYRYQQEVKAAEGNKDKLLMAEENKASSISKIRQSMDLLEDARGQELSKSRLEREQKFQDDLAAIRVKTTRQIGSEEEKIRIDLDKRYQKLMEDNVGDFDKMLELMAAKEKDFNELSLKANIDKWEEIGKNVLTVASQIVDIFKTIADAHTASENAQLAKDQKTNDGKKENLKKQLSTKKITQAQYDAAILKMDNDMDLKKKELQIKQAKRQRNIQIAQAIIGLAQSVMAGLNTTPFMPMGIIMGALAAVLGGIQLGVILSTPIPEAAKGRYNVIGESGQHYKNLPYIGAPKTGLYESAFIGAEKGREIIIDNPTTERILMNYPEIIQAIDYARVPQHATGRYYNPSAGPGLSGIPPIVIPQDNGQTTAINRLNDHLDRGIVALISYDHQVTENAKVADILQDVSK